MLGYTLRTTFLFSSKNKMLREDILSGTQQGSGMPGTTPTALTILWMVAWLDGFKACKRKIKAENIISRMLKGTCILQNKACFFKKGPVADTL